ncbi:uncharacterized protein LAESUDRAFT_808363 [Laetiporus sulphureus 93-53]|uniref:Uncharacterized protein n=1 Tax=Laetiporus sulphureus 93-53 TaxID=1314785 RepID=A0A165IB58_9APHY|nr:uncharacterized protein LAESUDRAFT_808363 [Laetiporus sulphureus 93-53]KZT12834.1 hypothetical protein LAESUDRAFT_808363 [Laetiporus sulphureus 93-53]
MLVSRMQGPHFPKGDQDGKLSIVVDSLDPILALSKYQRTKSAAPRLRLSKKLLAKQQRSDDESEPVRAMSAKERAFYASPYLRMLSTPLRQCFLTKRMLPSAFLLRFYPMRLPNLSFGKPAQLIVPDGLEHPDFKPRRAGAGYYIVLRNAALEQLSKKGGYKRLSNNVTMHSEFPRQISHLLRLRVLQEIHVLAERLRFRREGATEFPLIRRLTRAEYKQVRSTGIIPYENAVAVLVVPPLNRDQLTKKRPEPSMSSAPLDPPTVADSPPQYSRPLPPLSEFLRTGPETFEDDDSLSSLIPQSKVPLYNGLSLFPSRNQRAALHSALCDLLKIEWQHRFQENAQKARAARVSIPHTGTPRIPPDERKRKTPWPHGDDKGSHAFLLCSDEKTIMRADTVPLAIALWRIRIWEGAGWEGDAVGGWASS